MNSFKIVLAYSHITNQQAIHNNESLQLAIANWSINKVAT